jgi:hypothetical protein
LFIFSRDLCQLRELKGENGLRNEKGIKMEHGEKKGPMQGKEEDNFYLNS